MKSAGNWQLTLKVMGIEEGYVPVTIDVLEQGLSYQEEDHIVLVHGLRNYNAIIVPYDPQKHIIAGSNWTFGNKNDALEIIKEVDKNYRKTKNYIHGQEV